MKIAIIDFSPYEELKDTLDNLHILHKEIINPQIDLFIEDSVSIQLKEHDLVDNIYPIKLNDINIFNINMKYDKIRYYARNKYVIALDTSSTTLSAITTYIASGKTAGIKKSFFNDLFYDELVADTQNKKQNVINLFYKSFGIEKEDV